MMTGRHGGVVTLLEKECNNPVFRIWCVPHQLDIIIKNAMQDVLDQAFYKVQAERDSNNNARELEAPHVMPADLVKIRPTTFIQDVLDPYRTHLLKHWSQ
ncbi:unnamed protein product [Sphagnum jensenii]|uniref:Uncharacterized protein n=1 Tax=Sphagnum jensenii TaxID=128206 RepID=A0ABP1ABZ5_9BRYO